MTAAKSTCIGKGSKAADCSSVASDTLQTFSSRLGRGEADSYRISESPSEMGHLTRQAIGACLPEVGTRRRVPRSPTPAEAQPCHTRCAEGRGRIHASSHARSLVKRDYWALRGCKSSGQQFSASWLMQSSLPTDEELAKLYQVDAPHEVGRFRCAGLWHRRRRRLHLHVRQLPQVAQGSLG